jgi:putative ABC transport system permease protein
MRLWSWRRRDEDLDEEIRSHLEMAARDRVERGEDAEQAAAAARREFGNVGLVKEVTRETWGWVWLEQAAQDARYAARTMLKHRAFMATAMLTLAIGIGASTAIFSVVNAVELRPLPFRDPEALVMLWERDPAEGYERNAVAPPNFLDWQQRSRAFALMAAFSPGETFNLAGDAQPERVEGARVSATVFDVLGVTPALGRAFLADDERPGAERVALLSHDLWVRRYGADPGVVGRTISINGAPSTVVGVMPAGFEFPGGTGAVLGGSSNPRARVWVPLALTANELGQRSNHWLQVVARLGPGVSVEQAAAEMDAVERRIHEEHPDDYVGSQVTIDRLSDQVAGGVRAPLGLLLTAVVCVLLIGCVNVANLLLARAPTRRQEIAIRTALGASRRRVLRQLLTESVLLALGGGALGLALAGVGLRVLTQALPADFPRLGEIAIDGRVLGVTLGVCVLTGLLFGLAPAYAASTTDLVGGLKEGGRSSATGVAGSRTRSVLVVIEIALAVVLVTCAALTARSFVRLRQVDPGFDPGKVLTAEISLSPATYPTRARRAEFVARIVDAAERLPAARAVGAVTSLPLSGNNMNFAFDVEGRPTTADGRSPSADLRAVTPGYFAAMGIRVLRGRVFSRADDANAPPVLVVNETLARHYFPGEDPIGKRAKLGVNNFTGEIVGVVEDVRHGGLAAEVHEEVYCPYAQTPFWPTMTIVVKCDGDPAALAGPLRDQVLALDAEQPLAKVRTMEQVLADSVAAPRLRAGLLAMFGGVALVLAALGIYGVASYAVAQRRHEIGVRVALGAERRDVLRLVLGKGIGLTLVGLAVGLAASLGLARTISSLLYGVSPFDPLTFVGTPLVLFVVAVLANYVPARRATRVDPLVALRDE